MNKEIQLLKVQFEPLCYYIYSCVEVIDELIRRVQLDKSIHYDNVNSSIKAINIYTTDAKFSLHDFQNKIKEILTKYRNDERLDGLISCDSVVESCMLYLNQYIYLFDQLTEISEAEKYDYRFTYMIVLLDIQEIAVKLGKMFDKLNFIVRNL